MISPGDKLLLWTALLLPFAALAGLAPGWAGLCAWLFLTLGVLAAWDARRGRVLIRGLAVSLPAVVRLTKGRRGWIPVRIENKGMRPLRLRLGIPLPPALQSEQDALDVRLPSARPASAAAWPCTSRERGTLTVRDCYFEVDSPLGLWRVRGRTPGTTEVRTYPDLRREKRQLASFFLNRGAIGRHAQRMIGQGREFEQLRGYIPGDSFDDVHWKATAKRGHPVTKLYQLERTQEVYVAIDVSRLSGKAVGDEPAIERFITAALVLGTVAERQGDRVGLIAFGDRVRHFIRSGGGRAHHTIWQDTLYRLTPEAGSSDFNELFTFVRLHLRRRALLLILTDLGDPVMAEDFARTVEPVCRQHLVLATMIKERSTEPLFVTPDAVRVDGLYEKLGDHLIWETLRETGRKLQRRNVRLSLTTNERLCPDLVSQYMGVKARQVL